MFENRASSLILGILLSSLFVAWVKPKPLVEKVAEDKDISLNYEPTENCINDVRWLLRDALGLGWIEDREYSVKYCVNDTEAMLEFFIPGKDPSLDKMVLIKSGDFLRFHRGPFDAQPLCYDYLLKTSYRGNSTCKN